MQAAIGQPASSPSALPHSTSHTHTPHAAQVRALRAKKSAAPAVAAVATAAQPAQLQAPIGTSWFWGAGGGGPGAGLGGPVPPNPDAADLRPLYEHLPFRWAAGWAAGWGVSAFRASGGLVAAAWHQLVSPRCAAAPRPRAPCARVFPCSFRSARWSEEEQQKLRDGVVQLVQEVQLQEALQEMQQRLESGGAVGAGEYEAHKQRIAGLSLQSPGERGRGAWRGWEWTGGL